MQIAHSIPTRLGVTSLPPVPNYTRKINYQMARHSLLASVSIDCRAISQLTSHPVDALLMKT